MVSSTGRSGTPGEHTGVSSVSSESSEASTILPSNLIVPGLRQKTLGPQIRDTRTQKLRPMIQTTKTWTQRLSQKPVSLAKKADAELKRLTSKAAKSHQLFMLGKSSMLKLFQTTGIGEMSMERTSFPGTRINTSLSTVDHAGPKALLLPLLIDSIFSSRTKTQLQSPLMLKSWSTVELAAHVKAEIQVVFTSMRTSPVFQIPHVNNMLLWISINHVVHQSTCAETVLGHHVQRDKPASTSALPSTTDTIMLPITIVSPAPLK